MPRRKDVFEGRSLSNSDLVVNHRPLYKVAYNSKHRAIVLRVSKDLQPPRESRALTVNGSS